MGVDTGDPTVYPNKVNGIIFGESNGQLFSCSGSVVTTPNASVVLTAGHCVYDEGAFAQHLIFIPGYREETTPFGVWPVEAWYAPEGWVSSVNRGANNSAYDYGVLILGTLHGQYIAEQLGALGVAFDQNPQQLYTEYGYPAEPEPYDGSKLWAVTSPLTGLDFTFSPPTLQIASDFREGSSGGPWIVGPEDEVESLTTYFYLEDPYHIFGTYFGNAVESLYCSTGGIYVERVIENRHRGIDFVKVVVPCDGTITDYGSKIYAETRRERSFGGGIWLPVIPRYNVAKRLHRVHRLTVKVNFEFTPRNGEETREYTTVHLVESR